MIRFENVDKSYPNGFKALSAINLNIDHGEMCFLVGCSAAGKTSILKLITLLEPFNQGQIFVNNHSIKNLPAKKIPFLRRYIGMVFQDPEFIPNKTVFANVALPLTIIPTPKAEIERRTMAALDRVGLRNKEKALPKELSIGEQQRVGIARALVNKPLILLADEPTGNLDPDLSLDILNLFKSFNDAGVTTLIATHDRDLIAPMKKRMITMDAGIITGDSYAN